MLPVKLNCQNIDELFLVVTIYLMMFIGAKGKYSYAIHANTHGARNPY